MQRMNRDAHRLRGRWLQVAGRKDMRAPHPHTLRQERITCTLANKFAVFFLISWCRCIASAAVQPRRLVVHSTKSPAGAVQSAQWRELDSSSSRAPAELPAVMRCSGGSRSFTSRPLAVEPPRTGKNMRAAHPHTPRQERITCSRRTSLPFLNVSQIASLRKKIFSIFSFPPLDKTKDLIIIKDRTRLTGQSLKREKR